MLNSHKTSQPKIKHWHSIQTMGNDSKWKPLEAPAKSTAKDICYWSRGFAPQFGLHWLHSSMETADPTVTQTLARLHSLHGITDHNSGWIQQHFSCVRASSVRQPTSMLKDTHTDTHTHSWAAKSYLSTMLVLDCATLSTCWYLL